MNAIVLEVPRAPIVLLPATFRAREGSRRWWVMVSDGRCKCVGFMQNLGEGQTSRLTKAGIMGCGDGGCGAGCFCG